MPLLKREFVAQSLATYGVFNTKVFTCSFYMRVLMMTPTIRASVLPLAPEVEGLLALVKAGPTFGAIQFMSGVTQFVGTVHIFLCKQNYLLGVGPLPCNISCFSLLLL